MTPPRRRLLFVVCALLAGEATARFARDASELDEEGFSSNVDHHHADARLLRAARTRLGGFHGADGWVSINDSGHRGARDFTVERPGDVALRVAVVGAAGAFGLRVADGATWPEQLETRLRAAAAASGGAEAQVEVFNFAVPGSTVVHLERTVLGEVLPYAPDVVVIAYGGSNEALYAGASDAEHVDPRAHIRNALRGFALYRELERAAHAGLQRVRGMPRSCRVQVEEFEERLGRAARRFESAGARVVLLQDVAVHADGPGGRAGDDMPGYHAAVDRVGRDLGIAVVDPAEVFPPAGPQRVGAPTDGPGYGPAANAVIAVRIEAALL